MSRVKKPDFRSVLNFDSQPLALCLEKITEQRQYLQHVRAALPVHIAPHAVHCVLKGSRLLVYADGAAWASQIRFFQSAIVEALQSVNRSKVVSIQVRIIQNESAEPRLGSGAKLPAPSTVKGILGQMDDKSNDVLDKALAKLAKTLWKRVSG